jgi:DNA-binding response OmpR family regulator
MKNRISVLIVDESQTFSMYLALLLQRMGFKSLRVSQTESAKFVLSRGFTDFLIVGDLAGPEPKHQIVRELAASFPDSSIPTIVISRQDDLAEKQACHEAGGQAYLLKPVQPKALHAALNDHITPFSEKRINLRSKVDMISEISIDRQAPQQLQLLTLSRGGALVAYDKNLPTGTRISMSLPLEGELISLTGSVIYNLTNIDAKISRAFGVLFHQGNALHDERIEGYLESMLEECRLVSDSEATIVEDEQAAAV